MPGIPEARTASATGWNFVRDFESDLLYAARTWRKSPVFIVFVVLTLALAMSANTTVFTVVNTLLLNPLPVPKSSELVSVNAARAGSGASSAAPLQLPYADFKDIQSRTKAFASLAAYSSPRGVTWQAHNSSQGMFLELVTGNYFRTLGLTPARGRFFLPEEDGAPGAHPVTIINYRTWQLRFGGAADIVGRTLRLNRVVLTIIGVAPEHFIGINAIFGPDFWVPTAMAEQLYPTDMANVFSNRSKSLFQGIGRLRPGVSQRAARADLAELASDLAREYPATDEGRVAIVEPIRDALFANNGAQSGSILFGSVGLLVVVGVLLLIACSNVANLLLARAAGRHQEMAVRLALGADRGRLLRQLLTESILLAVLSGAVGLLFAYTALRGLFTVLPSGANFVTPKFDITVFLFALVMSFATGLLFGALPAFRATDVPVAESLKEGARTMGRSRRKVTWANTLLVGQVALSFLLLVLASLFLRSIGRAYTIDPGFQTTHLAVFMTNPGQAGYDHPRAKDFYREVREAVSQIAGVQSVSWASNMPLWARPATTVQVEGYEKRSRADIITTILNTVDRDYFITVDVRIQRGRAFTAVDQENSRPVAIVNQKFAHDYWPGQDPLGKRIQVAGEQQPRYVVGVARNANYTNWAEPAQSCVYLPLEQRYSDGMILYVRSKAGPLQVLPPIRQALHLIGPQVNISVLTGPELVKDGLFFAQAGVALLSIFGFVALGLASIGLYGILAYAVSERKREIGLRIALGAERWTVLRLIVGEGMSLVSAGVLIGLVAALLASGLLGRFLYGLSGADPISILRAAFVLSLVAFVACYLPAWRASRVDPSVALREG